MDPLFDASSKDSSNNSDNSMKIHTEALCTITHFQLCHQLTTHPPIKEGDLLGNTIVYGENAEDRDSTAIWKKTLEENVYFVSYNDIKKMDINTGKVL